VGAAMIEGILAGIAVMGIGVLLLAAAVVVVVAGDRRASRGSWWASDEREVQGRRPASRSSGASRGSQASSLCDGCGQLHPPEALPVELLIAAGVPVTLSRWFGRGA